MTLFSINGASVKVPPKELQTFKASQMGEFLVTHDSGNSIQYIENSQFIKSSFRDSTIVAAKQVRL